jgi:hypothetical protein
VFNHAEEFPRSSLKRVLGVSIAAALAILLATILYVFLNLRQPQASGEIVLLTAYPFHAEKRPVTLAESVARTIPLPNQSIVLAEVSITNMEQSPISISEVRAVMSKHDEQWWSDPISPEDFARVFVNYPELKPLRVSAIPSKTKILPGQSVHGMLIFHYPFSLEQWNQKSGFKVNVAFSSGKTLILPSPKSPNTSLDADNSSPDSNGSKPLSAD